MNDDRLTAKQDLFKTRMSALAGALFLFGLALVIWLDIFFPGILAVIWVTAIPPLLADKGWRMALWVETQVGIWFGGIALMLAQGSLWPGIFVLAGLSALLVAIAPPDHLEALHQEDQRGPGKAKRKRGAAGALAIPLPEHDTVTGADDPAAGENDMLYAEQAQEEEQDGKRETR